MIHLSMRHVIVLIIISTLLISACRTTTSSIVQQPRTEAVNVADASNQIAPTPTLTLLSATSVPQAPIIQIVEVVVTATPTDVPPTVTPLPPTPQPTPSPTPLPTLIAFKPTSSPPMFIAHVQPVIPQFVMPPALSARGCQWVGGISVLQNCDPALLELLDCDALSIPQQTLQGLFNDGVVVWCELMVAKSSADFPDDPRNGNAGYITARNNNGLRYLRLLNITTSGEFNLVNTQAQLATQLVPIASESQALSYATVFTDLTPYFWLELDSTLRYLTPVVESSYVRTTETGFTILLYSDQFSGCGPFTVNGYQLTVSFDGTMVQESIIPTFQDPRFDGVCIGGA